MAAPFLLSHEGGFKNEPDKDAADPTNYGITTPTLNAWNQSHEGYPANVAELTIDQAADIYEEQYWPGLDAVTSQAVGTKILDFRANFGVDGANRLTQLAANTLVDPPTAVDGQWGQDTIDSVNAADPAAMLQALADQAEARYQAIAAKHPEKAGYLAGWLKRAKDLPTVEIVEIVAGTSGLVILLAIGAALWLFNKKGAA